MHYRVLFDVTSPPWAGWLFAAAGLLFVVGGAIAYFVARERHGEKQARGAGIIVASIGVAFTFMMCSQVNSRHADLVADLRAGGVTTVEGRVSGFGVVHPGDSLRIALARGEIVRLERVQP